MADLYSQRRDVEKAIENWTQIARLAPSNLAVRSRLALTYERLGRRRQAVNEYLAIASILQHSGKPERAMEATRARPGVDPWRP